MFCVSKETRLYQLLILVLALVFFLSAQIAAAATINVTTTDDEWNATGSGVGCSLREAIQSANENEAWGGCSAGNGDDTINIPAGTYLITRLGRGEDDNVTGDFDFTDYQGIHLQGANDGKTIIDGGWNHPHFCGDRLFHVGDGDFGMDRIILTKGCINGGAQMGGAIYVDSCEDVYITNSVITENWADYGGGIGAECSLNHFDITNTTISKNYAGTFVIGGIGYGGGIYTYDDYIDLRNVTMTGNDALTDGGGFYAATGLGLLNLNNSIVGLNTSDGADDIHGPVSTDSKYSIIGSDNGIPESGEVCNHSAMQCDTAPKLFALGDYGGHTLTHALDYHSSNSAMDAAHCGSAPSRDQRGFKRGNPCDIGAFEYSLTAGEYCDDEDNECDSGNCNNSDVCCQDCQHGYCKSDGMCECDQGWDSTLCDKCATGVFGAACDGQCPACVNGSCDDGTGGSGICNCDDGWDGELCDIALSGDGDLDSDLDSDRIDVEMDEADADTADGDIMDGDMMDGDMMDGDVVDGDTTDGDVADGDTVIDGDITDGDILDGDTADGDLSDGDITDGDLPLTDGDESLADGDEPPADGDEPLVDGDTQPVDGDEGNGGVGDSGCRTTEPGPYAALILLLLGWSLRRRRSA